ncbi:MAG: HAD-IA family hydrolase [Armatimonadota bacterium]
MTHLIFDLDGTLTDPKEGMIESYNHVLKKFNLPMHESGFLERHIGPPIEEVFRELLDTENTDIINQAIICYRERYILQGYLENHVYDGIVEFLQDCKASDYRMFIATSKRQDIANMVLTRFQLTPFFSAVYGGDVGISKTDLLNRLLQEQELLPSSCLMIGDRKQDIDAGRGNNISTVGVLWGYGSQEELVSASADYLAHNPSELLNIAASLHIRW